MSSFARLGVWLNGEWSGWRTLSSAELTFRHRTDAYQAMLLVIGLILSMLVIRSLRRTPQRGLALPAILAWARRSRLSAVRHGPLILLLGGLPFFMFALADPYAAVSHREELFPGRRIALLIDASSSMLAPFAAEHLAAHVQHPAAFFTTVAAAEAFIRARRAGKYHDLIALVEFGDEAYVVTPFTSDYDNILLSTSLIGDWTEFNNFPDQGTTIALAIEQSVQLFRAFDFLDASGNALVLLSDGEDTQVTIHGSSVTDILAGAIHTKIPVYFVRLGFGKDKKITDEIWRPAVESTGGKFYPVADEGSLVRAIDDIDRLSAGRVQIRQYSAARPAFDPFALIAAGFWSLAALLKLTVPAFTRFP